MDATSRRDAAGPAGGRRPSPTSASRTTGIPEELQRGSHSSHDSTTTRRRSAAGTSGFDMTPQPLSRRRSTAALSGSDTASVDRRRRRRSSTFSAYSFTEAKQDLKEEILDPGLVVSVERQETSWKSRLPIMFAVVPPVAGVIFEGGAAFFTDILLLGLAAIFLHWSVTAPWKWYHSAQQIRETQEAAADEAVPEPGSAAVCDSESSRGASPSPAEQRHKDARKVEAALRKLRSQEMTALLTCFLAPAAAAYLLYFIRRGLSHRSESLVSEFNLTIFVLAAEIPPTSHLIKLILARTLHLQRVVQSSSYGEVRLTPERYDELIARIEDLEERVLHAQPNDKSNGLAGGGHNAKVQEEREAAVAARLHSSILRDVQASVQPQIEALNRAVRRYEKKTSMAELETERRLRDLRTRVDDAISLAAVVASQNSARRGLVGRLFCCAWYLAIWPWEKTFEVAIWLLGRGPHRIRARDNGAVTATASTWVAQPGAQRRITLGPVSTPSRARAMG